MWKKNIVIAGGGFAGLCAARRLLAHGAFLGIRFRIIVVDAKPCSEFLPLLPDVVGGWLKPERLQYDLERFAQRNGIEFVQGRIREFDLKDRKIRLDGTELAYEYAVLCTGSETNFFGNAQFGDACLKLDDVNDALRMRDALLAAAAVSPQVNVVIVGGGYTGVEIATNVHHLLTRFGRRCRIFMVEKSEHILAVLPDWVRREVEANLGRLGIETLCEDALEQYSGGEAIFQSGRRIGSAVCIWAAGVKTPAFVDDLALQKERSRIVVDAMLRPVDDPGCCAFVAGDTASFAREPSAKPLRMAVNFSLGQGRLAADNILRSIEERPLAAYVPVDLGYLVPMSNGRAPGIAKGVRVHGLLGYALHYLMCVRRAEWQNKAGILRDLISKHLSSASAEKEG